MNKINKKKKGFTLIELVIVLAVLAIIALIAIPNFTKVRNDSLAKADLRTAEQIEKITLMAIADKDITVPVPTATASYFYIITRSGDTVKVHPKDGTTAIIGTDYATMLKEVEMPQVNDKKTDGYQVEVTKNGDVIIKYGDDTVITENQ